MLESRLENLRRSKVAVLEMSWSPALDCAFLTATVWIGRAQTRFVRIRELFLNTMYSNEYFFALCTETLFPPAIFAVIFLKYRGVMAG